MIYMRLTLQQTVCQYSGDQKQKSDGEEGANGEALPQKRKSLPLSEEERKLRRKEINRQSARRIRERKSHEMENLKHQVGPPWSSLLGCTSNRPSRTSRIGAMRWGQCEACSHEN
jgi:hypothetical protein